MPALAEPTPSEQLQHRRDQTEILNRKRAQMGQPPVPLPEVPEVAPPPPSSPARPSTPPPPPAARRYRGVSSNGKRWQVRVTIDREVRSFGTFQDEIEAAKRFDKALADHGLYHLTPNFPDEMPPSWKEKATPPGWKEKAAPRTRHRGVIWNDERQAWQARILVDGTMKNLGLFDDDDDAAREYDLAIVEHPIDALGQPRVPNFPAEEPAPETPEVDDASTWAPIRRGLVVLGVFGSPTPAPPAEPPAPAVAMPAPTPVADPPAAGIWRAIPQDPPSPLDQELDLMCVLARTIKGRDPGAVRRSLEWLLARIGQD